MKGFVFSGGPNGQCAQAERERERESAHVNLKEKTLNPRQHAVVEAWQASHGLEAAGRIYRAAPPAPQYRGLHIYTINGIPFYLIVLFTPKPYSRYGVLYPEALL